MKPSLVVIFSILSIITLFCASFQSVDAAPKKKSEPVSVLLSRAAAAFKSADYDQAISNYRKYLQKRPKDYNSWNNLAASYYHTGLPARAARYLKFVEKKTTQKSYNNYYLGLAYTAMNKNSLARKKFSFAARFIDEYGSRASFEMAVLEYNVKDYAKASYWINLYLQRYPTGTFAAICQQMAQSIRTGTHIPDIEGNKKPDMEKALFRYNRFSLSPNPHYWFFQLGSVYDQRSEKSPTSKQILKSIEAVDYALLINAGIGYGPVRKGDSLAFGGYTYRQRWNTDDDRLSTFLDDFDPTYFPFRGDILERSHELYGDYRHQIRKNIYAGFFTRKEFKFSGSDIIPGPDQPSDVTSSTIVSDTTLLIPWIGISYLDSFYTLFYLYFRKEINSLTSEFSSKTYSIFGDEDALFSYGLSHNMEFPKNKLRVNIEAFQYEFIYNDYWLDYNRTGAIFSAEYEFYPKFFIRGLFGIYTDVYILDQLKQGTCEYVELKQSKTDYPKTCRRTDDGKLFEISGHWDYSQFHRLEASIAQVSNQNPSLKVYDKSKLTLEFRLTWAFPNAERVIRYVDRFADSAFTKEAE